MKKRFLASVLALVMALSLLPLNALAEDYSAGNFVPGETTLVKGDTYTLDTDDASNLPEAPEGLRWDGPESIKGDRIICGKNAHQHDSDCYEWEWFLFIPYRKLVCNKEEHTHSDYCYNHTYKWKLVDENEITTSNTWRRWWPVYWTLSKSSGIDANGAIESVTAGTNVAYTSGALSSKQALDGTTATLGDAVDAGGFTITTKPGYYVEAARVVCGNYTGCGVSGDLVPTGQTENNYSNTIDIRFDQGNNDLNFDHLSANGNGVNLPKDYPTSKPTGDDYHNELKVGRITNTLYPYYFLIQVAQDDRTYSVRYDWGDQTLSSDVPYSKTNLKRNESYEVLRPSDDAIAEAATKNLAFAGWKDNDSNKTYQAGESFSVSANVTLTAQWTQLYTVSYDLDSGKWKDGETVETAKYPENAPVSVTSNEPERSGYEFIDWTITEPKTNPPKINTDETTDVKTFTMPAANVILMAQWKLIEAAKLSVEKTVTKVGETTVAASKAIPTAYPGDVIVWTITVTNSGNAAGNFTLKETLSDITVKDITTNTEVKPNTDGEWSGTVAAGESVSYTVTYTVKATDVTDAGLINKVTLKQDGENDKEAESDRVPTAMKYTVTYDLAGGKIGTDTTYTDSSSPYAKDAAVTVAPDPTKEGHTFVDWTVTTDNTSVGAPAINKTSNTFTMPAANVTLTATWTVNEYKVTYQYAGTVPTGVPDAPVDDAKHAYNTSVDVKAASPFAGYTFDGWYENSDCTGTKVGTTITMPAHDVSLYGKWTPNTNTKYTVNHYKQIIGGKVVANGTTYRLENTEYETGTTGGQTKAVAKTTYTGFKNLPFEQKTIAADGSTVVDIYYNHLASAVSYIDGVGGAAFESQNYEADYGTVPHAFEGTPTRKGWTFDRWYCSQENRYYTDAEIATMTVTGPLTFIAQWTVEPITVDLKDLDGVGNAAVYKDLEISKGSAKLPNNFEETFVATITPANKATIAANTMGSNSFYRGEAKVTKDNYDKLVPFVFEGPSAYASGYVDYGKLLFTKEGTYTYTVKEIIPANKDKVSGVTYDENTYTLTIIVGKNATGLYVEQYYVGDNAPENNKSTYVVITNTYYKRAYRPSTPSVTKPALNTDDHYAYVMGYPDGTVQPGGYITRAEASTIFFRLLTDATREEYWAVSNEYTDVKDGDWYNNAISTLSNAGIVSGYPDGTFRPNAPITRAEMSKIIALFAKLDKTNDRFTDIAGHWAEAYIRLAAGNGWIEGYPDGSFRPNQSITRAETVTMINRVLERVPSDEDHLLSERVMLTFPDCKSGDWFYIAIQEATNSHTYERAVTEKNGDEQWTALRDNRDWTKLEY